MEGVPLLSQISLQLFRKAQISGRNRRRHTAFLLGRRILNFYLPWASLKTGIFEICRTGIESDYSCRSDMTCFPRRYSAVVSELYVWRSSCILRSFVRHNETQTNDLHRWHKFGLCCMISPFSATILLVLLILTGKRIKKCAKMVSRLKDLYRHLYKHFKLSNAKKLLTISLKKTKFGRLYKNNIK